MLQSHLLQHLKNKAGLVVSRGAKYLQKYLAYPFLTLFTDLQEIIIIFMEDEVLTPLCLTLPLKKEKLVFFIFPEISAKIGLGLHVKQSEKITHNGPIQLDVLNFMGKTYFRAFKHHWA